jgi:beta-lactamase class D
LHKTAKRGICSSTKKWGRTGFDSSLEAQAACRGWFVGLVKNRTKKQTQTTKVSLSRLN